jgi:hypothetical protein
MSSTTSSSSPSHPAPAASPAGSRSTRTLKSASTPSDYWAVRGGFNNITGRRNYTLVNNDINSPGFLTFSNYQGRAFTGRIRFLGKK